MYQSSHNLKTNNMKKLVVISILAIVLMSSCVTQKMTTSTDDVYANPTEVKKEEARLASIRQQQQDVANKRYSDSLANIKMAQQAKDDANPAYKDREFKYDDYYDYEYATRVKRFNNNINGLSYYDNYYTNSYWYNKNPYNYGVSVYSGYSWWGNSYNNYSYNPQSNFYNSYGWNSSPSYGYNGYNPYNSSGYGYGNGYGNGYNNGYNSYPYYGSGYGNSYGYGGYNPYGGYYGNSYGYGNGYNNNSWGYYNSYDHNSQYTYGPRSSHGGGNGHRTSNVGMSTDTDNGGYYNRYASSVVDHQNHAVKFETLPNVRVTNESNPIRVDSKGNVMENSNNIKPSISYDNNGTAPVRNGTIIRNAEHKADVYTTPINSNSHYIENDNNNNNNNGVIRNNNTYQNNNNTNIYEKPAYNTEPKPIRNQYDAKPVETKPIYQEPPRDNYQQPNNNNNQTPTNNGDSQPRNSGGDGGGGGRPR